MRVIAPLLLGCLGAVGWASGKTEDSPTVMALPSLQAVELAEGQKLAVVASTSLVGDVVANVGADLIDLTVLIGAGQDPHSYEPTPRALAAVQNAHVVFVNGLHLEQGILRVVEKAAHVPLAPVSAGIEPLEYGNDQEQGHHVQDPHFWMDPTNVMVWTESIAHVLSEADPAHGGIYQENAARYRARLQEIDTSIRHRLSQLPAAQRRLVTDHRVLGYFAQEYGLQVVGVVASGSASAVSAKDSAALIEVLRKTGVTTIFIGSTAGRGLQSLTEAISEELDVELRIVPILTDALAPRGQRGATYLDFMEYNVEQIVTGLSR